MSTKFQAQHCDTMAEVRVAPNFKLNRASAIAWVEGGCAKPEER